MNKKIAIVIAIVIYLTSGYFSYSFFIKKEEGGQIHLPVVSYIKPEEKETNNNKKNLKEPKTEECPLNGQLFGKSQKAQWEKRRPLGVMIENHVEARPQSGLTSADIVYEAVAEGGITRFLAIFYCQDAKYIGPIRSARIYFIHLLTEYGNHPLYAHVGGANTPGPADALGEIKKLNWDLYNDLNQFGVPFPYFWRDYERLPSRATEHTVYSSTKKLWDYAKTKRNLTDVDENNNRWDEDFTKWQFKNDSKISATINKISFDFWQGKSDYSVEWQYDQSTNSFKRFNGSQPHTDKNNGRQIEAKNVVIVFMDESLANDNYEGGHLLYQTIGKGEMILFQDGKVIKGEWRKKDNFSRMKFYETDGKEIAFNRGQIFIEILPTGNKVNYQ